MLPAGLRDTTADNCVELVAPIAAQHGEPWLTFLTPTDMSTLLTRHGFTSIRHIHQRDTVDAALWQRADPLHPTELSVIAHATLPTRS